MYGRIVFLDWRRSLIAAIALALLLSGVLALLFRRRPAG